MGILLIIISVSLGLMVLIQNSKDGGLISRFASENKVFGVAKTKNVLEKITWGAAGIFFLLCLLSAN